YVAAIAYAAAFGASGWLIKTDADYSIWEVSAVLIALTFPFVYVTLASAMESMDSNWEEAAMSLGKGRWS
ncbi:MAG: iron ABC transporter permease, partial [Candidatus Binatia bacterium]